METLHNSAYLSSIFDGWEGYQASLLHAIQGLTTDQLIWRPAPQLRSMGEVASYIAIGCVIWFTRMPSPGSLALKKVDS